MKLLALSLLMSFSALAFDPTVKVEYQINNVLWQSDILFVIDNSGSMETHQKLLADLSDEFLKQFGRMNYRITAVSTSKGEDLKNPIISNTSADPIAEMARLITNFGTSGDGTELVFQRTHDFMVSEVGQNFMRSNTPLEIILVTDEEEQSTQTVQDMMALSSIKKFTVSGLLPVITPTSCTNSTPRTNTKIEELISQSGGLMLDLCKEHTALSNDYENLAKAIMQRATHKKLPVTNFVFKDSIDINSVRVYYGSQVIPRGFLKTGWTYDEVSNTLYLGEAIVLGNQPFGTKFTIQYDIL